MMSEPALKELVTARKIHASGEDAIPAIIAALRIDHPTLDDADLFAKAKQISDRWDGEVQA